MSQSELRTALRELLFVHERLALCLDFDGTLAPIVEDPDRATLPPGTRRQMAELASNPAVDVAVISGRALEDIRARVDIPEVSYAGNHGLEFEQDGSTWVHPDVDSHRDALARACRRLQRELEPLAGCFVEDKYATATVHYRRADTDDSRRAMAVTRDVAEREQKLETVVDEQAVEIRPDIDHHKGDAVEELVDIEGAPLIVYLGDAATDVDAFRTLDAIDGDAVRISVGGDLPAAGWNLDSPATVESFLHWLGIELGAADE